MNAGEQIQLDAQEELAYDPAVDSARITVAATPDGVVTLRGVVPTYMQSRAAEKAVQRVRGVSAVANELMVKPYQPEMLDDTAIAAAAATALQHSATVPRGAVKVAVSKGWVTLDGAVPWDYQRRSALRAIRDIAGIRGVVNRVEIKPAAKAGDIKDLIEAAFQRQALSGPQHLSVDVIANRVILRGRVSTWAQREAAEQAAYSACGVAEVDNQVAVLAPAFV